MGVDVLPAFGQYGRGMGGIDTEQIERVIKVPLKFSSRHYFYYFIYICVSVCMYGVYVYVCICVCA